VTDPRALISQLHLHADAERFPRGPMWAFYHDVADALEAALADTERLDWLDDAIEYKDRGDGYKTTILSGVVRETIGFAERWVVYGKGRQILGPFDKVRAAIDAAKEDVTQVKA
jgi:hypothetical protein